MASATSQDTVIDHALGELEAPIMRLMWNRSSASVREIVAELNAGEKSLAYTTVMTVMARLAEKGFLIRERRGNMYVYSAATTQDGFVRLIAARRVQELVAEFGDTVVAQFLSEVAELSPERRRQLEIISQGDGT